MSPPSSGASAVRNDGVITICGVPGDPNSYKAKLTGVQKDILDLCPNSFDEILQVLVLKNRTTAASRARTGCGSNH